GKTRLLYEAARTVLPDYEVLAPTLGDGAVVNEIAETTSHRPLLIWLDDLQRFLDGPYLTGPATSITPDAVRRLLNDRSVIMVGTLWPEYAAHLRATTAGSTPGSRVARYQAAVDILDDARLHEIAVRTFSPAEREAARRLGAADPRLA